jgi:hypothetical protein
VGVGGVSPPLRDGAVRGRAGIGSVVIDGSETQDCFESIRPGAALPLVTKNVGIDGVVIGRLPRLVVSLIWLVPLVCAQDPALLQVRVVEGEAAVYAIGSRATKGITIQVTDETGKPVDGATIGFRLPESGPSGAFANGSKTEIATTRPDGRAAAWGMQWNRTPGLLEIRITAVKGPTRAGIVCPQYLTDAPGSASSHMSSGGSHKWVWIVVAVAGAAGGSLAAVALGSKTSSTPAATVTAVQIGAPTITIGHP